MRRLGIRELKNHLSELVDEVREGEVIEITKHGQPVARIIPIPADGPLDRDKGGVWTSLNRLRDELRSSWPKDVSAQDVINDIRS